MNSENEPLTLIAQKLQLSQVLALPSQEDQFKAFAAYLDQLISSDFNKLLSILYRVDASEEKVKKELAKHQNHFTAGHIIAQLLLERETEKIKFRAQYKNK